MNQELLNKLKSIELSESKTSLIDIENRLSQLPEDYKEFIAIYDGGAGFISDNTQYLHLWTFEDVSKLNPYFPDEQFSNEVIIIGSNGGGTLYGYDLVTNNFFLTDEYQMSREEVTECGDTFLEMINFLERRTE